MQLIHSHRLLAQEIMDKDLLLLKDLDPKGEAILHLYEWQQDSATYGYFVNISDHLHIENAKKMGLQLARRPTGGGIIFHRFDLAFSLLIPAEHPKLAKKSLENYQLVNECVRKAIAPFLSSHETCSLLPEETEGDKLLFCMAKPTKYDLMLSSKKIVGAAQRRKANGLLHQGSISLRCPDQSFLEKVILSKKVVEAMMEGSFSLFGDLSEDLFLQKKELLKKRLYETFINQLR